MGSTNSKVPFTSKHAQIGVTIEKPSYHSGEMIKGAAHLNVIKPFPLSAIILRIWGKEKIKFWYRSGKHRHSAVGARIIFDAKSDLAHFTDTIIMGQYVFPFIIDVPMGITPSFQYEDDAFLNKSFAKVVYKIRVLASSSDRSIELIGSTTPLLLSECPKVKIPPPLMDYDKEVYCCCSSGKSKIYLSCDKAVYVLGETINVGMRIDNSNCTVDVITAKIFIKKSLNLEGTTNGIFLNSQRSSTRDFTIAIQEFPITLKARCCEKDFRTYPINMAQDLSFEELVKNYMPTCLSAFIKCSYLITVTLNHNASECSDMLMKLPIQIIMPEVKKSQQQYNLPQDGWNPTESKIAMIKIPTTDGPTAPYTMK
jgi:hypothetical protein